MWQLAQWCCTSGTWTNQSNTEIKKIWELLITCSLSFKILSKAAGGILGTDATVSAMNLPILLSGAARPSWEENDIRYKAKSRGRTKDTRWVFFVSDHNIINIFVDVIDQSTQSVHWNFHYFQIIGKFVHHRWLQNVNCQQTIMHIKFSEVCRVQIIW